MPTEIIGDEYDDNFQQKLFSYHVGKINRSCRSEM